MWPLCESRQFVQSKGNQFSTNGSAARSVNVATACACDGLPCFTDYLEEQRNEVEILKSIFTATVFSGYPAGPAHALSQI